jgi:integrase
VLGAHLHGQQQRGDVEVPGVQGRRYLASGLAAGNVRRALRAITKAAGTGENWTPRELRHSFVSILSDNGVTVEAIADLVGHKTTIVTQKVYRHQLRPVITTAATTMNTIFTKRKGAKSACLWLPVWLPRLFQASRIAWSLGDSNP